MSEPVIFHFEKPGLHTTIQDLGRSGHQQFGVPVGGVLDKNAGIQANALLGNAPQQPVLEITLVGPVIKVEGNCTIALTGADLSATLNGKVLKRYQPVSIVSGDVLAFGKPVSGCRAYLAVGGEWQVPSWLGSCSAIRPFAAENFMQKGSRIKIFPVFEHPVSSTKQAPVFESHRNVNVSKGPEFDVFSNTTIASFFEQKHVLSADCNRMGIRLKTRLAAYEAPISILSSGIVPGTIQITPNGQPIVLLADAQTVGGYPRIAVLQEDALNAMAQLRPGDSVGFLLV